MTPHFKCIPVLALASVLSMPASADSGATQVGGEVGFTTHATPALTTRSEVLKALEAWKRNPVTADGWREVGGEAGWVFVGRKPGDQTPSMASMPTPAPPADGRTIGGLSRSGHMSGR